MILSWHKSIKTLRFNCIFQYFFKWRIVKKYASKCTKYTYLWVHVNFYFNMLWIIIIIACEHRCSWMLPMLPTYTEIFFLVDSCFGTEWNSMSFWNNVDGIKLFLSQVLSTVTLALYFVELNAELLIKLWNLSKIFFCVLMYERRINIQYPMAGGWKWFLSNELCVCYLRTLA